MQTEAKSEQKIDGQAANGAAPLAKPATPVAGDLVPHAGAQAIVWSRERIELIKRQICPAGITDDEFAIFIEQCKRTQLDPLIKEAYCVPRRVKIEKPNPNDPGGRPIEMWVTKHEFQPAEAGMAARADRFPDFKGIKAAAVYEKDQILIDANEGTVQHQYNPVGNRGKLVGAWARAYREGRHTPVEWVSLEEFIQVTKDGRPTGQWSQKDEVMITKCARAAAWRRAYPNVFGGLYIEEEMGGRDEREVNAAPDRSPEQEAHGGQTRTDRVAAKVAAKVQSSAATTTVDAAPAAPVARFGSEAVRLKPLTTLSVAQLTELEAMGERYLSEQPGASWAGSVKTNLEEIRAELKRRPAAPKQAAPPPGFEAVEADPPPPGLPADQQGPPAQKEPF